MKKFIVISMICALLSMSYALCLQMSKKPKIEYIEPTTTSETTTSSTTTTTTRKTTKKAVKTTRKTTKIHKVNTAGKEEYINYAKQVGGYNDTQMSCLINLWNRESGWNPNAVNKSSGACGIPQAYPCNKIAKTKGTNNWKTQIEWGIDYIRSNPNYKTPCGAWDFWKKNHWY